MRREEDNMSLFTFLSWYSRICSSTKSRLFTVFDREDWRSTVSADSMALAEGFRARLGRIIASLSVVAGCCGG